MKELEKTKRFNVEDINISSKEEQKENLETTALEESMDELDEIISEDKNSKDFNSDGFEIELEENQESAETVDKKDIAKEDVKEIIEEEIELSNELDEEVIETHNDEISPELESIVKNDYQEETIVNINIPEGKSIGIASDHRGYKLKQKLTKYLTNKGYTVVDLGTDGSFSVDYPEFGFKLGEAVADYEVQKGIAICGSGIGISIACNKIKGVRCAKVDNVKEVKYARKDNDANVIAIAGNMPLFRAKDIVDAYLKTPFTGLDRHKRRIEMLDNRG